MFLSTPCLSIANKQVGSGFPSMTVRPVKFFVLTFALWWLIWVPLVISNFGIGPFHITEGTSNIVRFAKGENQNDK